MPLIPFPDIPAYPGVPQLVRGLNIPPSLQISLGVVQGLLAAAVQNPTQWGIFDSQGNQLGILANGNSLFQSLTVLVVGGGPPVLSNNATEFSKETKISDFPVEEGSFANYNKVEMPANPTVTLALTGSEPDRTAFLNLINAACTSTELYSVVTPEVTYYNYSVERYNYVRRAERGATLLLVEISLKEIREVSAAFSNVQTPIDVPQNPAATPQVNAGAVQPQIPATSILKSAATAWPSLASSLGVN